VALRASSHKKDKRAAENLKAVLRDESERQHEAVGEHSRLQEKEAVAPSKRSERVQVRQLAELEEARQDRALEEMMSKTQRKVKFEAHLPVKKKRDDDG